MRAGFFTLVIAAAVLAGPAAPAQQAITEAYLFTPPGCGGSSPFTDVPAADAYCPWIKQFGADGISPGCGGGKFCPDQPVTRKQIALLLERAMRGTPSWEPWRGAYRRTLIVNPVPGNSLASGARLLAALAEITNAAYGNSYLVKLEPGRYDLGSQALDLKPFVDLEGSGVDKTEIFGSRNQALVLGADDVELRSLKIWNSNADNPVGLAISGDSIRLTDVRVITSGELSSTGIQGAGADAVLTRVSTLNVAWQPGSSAYGVTVSGSAVLRDCQIEVQAQSGTARGISAFAGAPLFERVRVVLDGSTQIAMRIDTGANATLLQVDLLPKYGTGTGIAMFDGSATIVDSRIELGAAGTVGIDCSAASSHTVTIRNSRLGGANAITGDPQCTFKIANSQMWGDIVDNGSPVTCFGTYDDSYHTKFCS